MPPRDYKQTLCWGCANAYGRCSWSQSFTPVDGWTATPTKIHYNGVNTESIPSFLVERCPSFKEG